MSLILVAEPEGRHVERIRDALGPEGFRVHVVAGTEQALAAAGSEPPQLVLVASGLAGAGQLFETFGRRTGGPGVVALVPETEGGRVAAEQIGADELLVKPFTDEDLRGAVRRLLHAPAATPAAVVADPGEQLTSEDIFGDLVAEVESELALPRQPPAEPPAAPVASRSAATRAARAEAPTPAERPGPQLDPVLEKTLSGLRDLAPRDVRPPRRRSLDDTDVDALLSETLSGLDLPRRRPARPERAKPEPVKPKPAKTATPGPEPLGERTPATPSSPTAASETPPPAEPEAPASPSSSAPSTPPAPEAPVRATVPPSADPRRFGQYTLLDRIAVGGMAEVWKARMTGVEGFQKTVAIKKILSHLTDNDDFVSMFVDEAKLAAQLNHPNIVHIYDLGKIDQHYFIAMEYVEGMNLRGLLNQARLKGRPLPRGLGLLIGARLAAALEYAHKKRDADGRELGLVHRDVSPQNVLLSYDGDIKLCDFGIVKAVTKASQTQMGALKGKLQYMSPEQAWGKSVDARSDVFSLGALLFEMLTGRRLFGGDSEISVLEAVRQCRVIAPRQLAPELSPEAEEVVLKALEHDPEKRYASAGALQQDLEKILLESRPSPGQADLASYLEELVRAPELERPMAEPEPAASAVFGEEEEPEVEEDGLSGPSGPPEDTPLSTSSTQSTPSTLPTGPEPSTEAPDPAVATEAPEAPEATESAEPTELEPEEPRRSRRWLPWLLLAVLLLLAAGLAAVYLLRGGEEAAPPVVTPMETEEPGEPPPALAAPGEEAAADTEGAGSGEAVDAQDAVGAQDAAGAQEVDLDSLVEEALAAEEARLRQRFEEEERRLRRQLEETRSQLAEPPPETERPPQQAPPPGGTGGPAALSPP